MSDIFDSCESKMASSTMLVEVVSSSTLVRYKTRQSVFGRFHSQTWNPLHCIMVFKKPDVTVRHSNITSLEMKLQISQDESSGSKAVCYYYTAPETKMHEVMHKLLKYLKRRCVMSRLITGMKVSYSDSSDSFNSHRSQNPDQKLV